MLLINICSTTTVGKPYVNYTLLVTQKLSISLMVRELYIQFTKVIQRTNWSSD